MGNIRCWLTLLAVTGLLAAGMAVVPAASAMAAGCNSNGCAGHDPVVEGCNIGPETHKTSTIMDATNTVVLATLVNWYSVNCNANWVTGQLSPTALKLGMSLQIEVDGYSDQQAFNQGFLDESMCYPGDNNTGHWDECTPPLAQGLYFGSNQAFTDMVNGQFTAFGQLRLFDSNGNYVTHATVNQ